MRIVHQLRVEKPRSARTAGLWIVTAFTLATLSAIAPNHSQSTPQPPNVIFDTDMYSDIDDMLALAALNTLQDRGEARLIGVTISSDAESIPSYVDLINTYYGHPNVPIGMIHGGITANTYNRKPFTDGPRPWMPNGMNYTQYFSRLRKKNGDLAYPHKLVDGRKAEDSVRLLRRLLAGQPDQSVIIIQVGFSTNMAHLLRSSADQFSQRDGKTLVKKKVRLLSLMGGNFAKADGNPAGDSQIEFNVSMDIPSSQELFENWPSPIVISGYEIGAKLLFPEKSIYTHFRYTHGNPIADTYRYLAPFYKAASGSPSAPHNHPLWDVTAVLFGVRSDDNYFGVSPPGKVIVLDNGSTRFDPDQGGLHRYLTMSEEQKPRALEAMEMLITEPPIRQAVEQ